SILSEEFPFKNLKIVKNTHNHGAAGNRNNAADYAQYDLLQFLDDDILITENFLERLIYWHNKLENISIGSKLLYSKKVKEIAKKTSFGRYMIKKEYINEINEFIHFNNDGLYEVNSLAGFSISMKRETFDKVRDFDENFDYAGCEDAEFFYRASQKNVKLLFDEKNICYHNELDNFTLDTWLRRQSTGIRSAVVVCKLHPEGQNHPTWYTNTPLKKSDPKDVKLLKLKKIICSFPPVYNFIHFLAIYSEKIKFPDSFLFILYNALWLGATYREFREAYKEIFKNKKHED
ncbi:MAG: glycosyltransferase, partial [Bacteroidales bacterium]